MWYRKLFSEANHWAMLRETKGKSETAKRLGLVSCLDHRLFERLNMRYACTDTVNPEVSSIRSYAYTLRILSGLDWGAETINLKTYGFSKQPVTIERFFYSKDGRLLDPSEEVLGFKLAVTEFIGKFKNEDAIGEERFNKRRLLPLLFNAMEVIEGLRNHSLQS